MSESAIERRAAPAGTGSTLTAYRVLVYSACVVSAMVCDYVLGKDMAWDTVGYHLYAGFSAFNDRFGLDYFPAGPQSYFNPYIYVPFYYLVSHGVPALAMSLMFAAVHSIILWLTFELGIAVSPSGDIRSRVAMGVCATVLAFMNPILMQQMGSCFADISTAELALAGWVLLACAVRLPNTSSIVCAGLCLGLAVGFKLTNAVHAIAAYAVLILLPLPWHGRIRQGLLFGISLAIGFAMVCVPWSYRLETRFGNPLFPFANNVFHSPEFTSEPLKHYRFIPDSLVEALWRPFAMIDPVTMVQEELRAPDLRYAVLALLAAMLAISWLRLRAARHDGPEAKKFDVSTRVLAALGFGFAVDWTLWLSGSGNGRYFLPMACVAAVVIVGLLFRVFAAQPKVRNYTLAAIFAVQAVQLWMGTNYRWNEAPWGGPWFDVSIPEKLRTEPNLYLSIGAQSYSFIAPYLATGSGLVNFSGGYALGPDGENGARVGALLQKFGPHLRMLTRGAKLYEDSERRAPRRSQMDAALGRFGLRTDLNDCATITVKGLPADVEIRYLSSSEPGEPQRRDNTLLVSCHVVRDSMDHSAEIARQKVVDRVFDRLEDACPKLFQPRRLRTERDGDTWQRLYMNTDVTAWISHGWVKFRNPVRGGDRVVFLGRESDWTRAPLRLECGRRNGSYFARVIGANAAY